MSTIKFGVANSFGFMSADRHTETHRQSQEMTLITLDKVKR